MTSQKSPSLEQHGDDCRPPEGTKSETYHWLDCGYLVPFAWREGEGGAWWSNSGEDELFSPAQMSDWGWKYVSPCLTPTQIADMLAGVEPYAWEHEQTRTLQYATPLYMTEGGNKVSPGYKPLYEHPAHVREMLAAERERCANVCKTLIARDENRYGVGLKTTSAEARIKALAEAQRLIRNLGDAP